LVFAPSFSWPHGASLEAEKLAVKAGGSRRLRYVTYTDSQAKKRRANFAEIRFSDGQITRGPDVGQLPRQWPW